MNYLDPPVISIDGERCQQDGLCARLCPVRIFDVSAGGRPAVSRTEECCLCGHCVAGCASGAIRHSGFEVCQARAVDCATGVTPKAAYDFISGRRSVRAYKHDVPSRELLEQIIEVAAYAPGSPNHRVGWVRSFAVVVGHEPMHAVLEMTVEYMRRSHRLITGLMVRTAAHFDPSAKAAQEVVPDLAMRLKEYEAGRDAILYGAPAAVFAYAPVASSFPQTDCDAAMYSVLLMAHAHGLGGCWNGLLQGAAAGDHLRGFTILSDFLKIPRGHKCYAAATLGHPAITLHRVPPRKVGITWIDNETTASGAKAGSTVRGPRG